MLSAEPDTYQNTMVTKRLLFSLVGCIALCIVGLWTLAVPVYAQGAGVFQAVCIYNFTKYITLPPARQTGDYIIAVVGKTETTAQLERMAAVRRVPATNQAIKVVDLDNVSPADCHLIYIPEKFSKRTKSVADAVKGKPVVIVTEGVNQYQAGSGISFVFNAERKFEVNRGLLEANNMKVSSELLRVATIVGN
jgi:hypothetical protein